MPMERNGYIAGNHNIELMGSSKLKEAYKEYRAWPRWYYHLTFDSLEKGQLFNNDYEYACGMNDIAVGQYIHKLTIIAFVLMVNHIHILLSGSGKDIVDLFIFLKKRANKRLRAAGHLSLPNGYGFKLVRIEDKRQLSDTIIYIARNPLKARPDITAGGYLWGSTNLIFSDASKLFAKKELGNMSEREIIKRIRTKVALPKNYLFNESLGIILPESYVDVRKAEQCLQDSWKFSSGLIRNIDSYLRIAEGIGEMVTISEGELDEIIFHSLRKEFNVNSINDLSMDNRCRLAVILKKRYRVDTKRIARRLRIDVAVLNNLFE